MAQPNTYLHGELEVGTKMSGNLFRPGPHCIALARPVTFIETEFFFPVLGLGYAKILVPLSDLFYPKHTWTVGASLIQLTFGAHEPYNSRKDQKFRSVNGDSTNFGIVLLFRNLHFFRFWRSWRQNKINLADFLAQSEPAKGCGFNTYRRERGAYTPYRVPATMRYSNRRHDPFRIALSANAKRATNKRLLEQC